MSLFRSREWWTINLNENEMYDSQCIFIITLEGDKCQSILLGNHKGVLRLFSPKSELPMEGILTYKASHLLLEVQLGSPILQMNEGAFISGSSNTYLAILHPRLFSVYSLKKKENKENQLGDQIEIELAYQHVLRHSAHSFALGPFGGVRNRSFICIQALDGLLSFYEQESFAFQLYLPAFILPSTFAYLEKIDSFLFLNGFLTLDCYSYEALVSAGSLTEKKITKTWEYNLGESILDINVVSKKDLIVVVLSERNLYGLNENGKMVFMRRLESKPVAICTYLTEENKTLMLIIATEGGFLNFYEEVNLKWSMKIDFIPVSIKRIFICSLPGGIALLSEDGLLQIVYIGTHPSLYAIPFLVQPEIDVQKAESELKLLQKKIAENDVEDPLTDDLISVNLKVDKNAEDIINARSCNLKLEISVQCLISKIQILFTVESPLMLRTQSKSIFNCSEETYVENNVYVTDSGIISSLTVQAIVTYTTNEGVIRSIQKCGILPLDLVVVESMPIKETLHKITITTSKPVCGVNHLFREFASENTSSNAIGLKFISGNIVSILSAKSSQKYRLQSDSLAAITIILQALLQRLKVHFQRDAEFNETYSAPLPLDEFFEKIKLHQRLIQKRATLEEVLSKQTSQYIAVQKKILSKLKDVNQPKPKSSSNFHNILKYTSKIIKTSIGDLENTEKELLFSRSNLRSMNRLMITLLELMPVKEEDLKILKIAFNPHIQDSEEQGWLEVQEVAMSFLLRTALAKSEKDQQKPGDLLLEPLTDISKLTKHFTSVIERVTKGTYLLERNDFEGKKESLVTIQAAYELEEGFSDDIVPVTTKLLTTESKFAKVNSKLELNCEAEALTTMRKNEKEKEFSLAKKTPEKLYTPLAQEPTTTKSEESERDDDKNEDNDGVWDIKIMEMRI